MAVALSSYFLASFLPLSVSFLISFYNLLLNIILSIGSMWFTSISMERLRIEYQALINILDIDINRIFRQGETSGNDTILSDLFVSGIHAYIENYCRLDDALVGSLMGSFSATSVSLAGQPRWQRFALGHTGPARAALLDRSA
jgi:hypothetical protein